MEAAANSKVTEVCYHCGDVLDSSFYSFSDHNFCCLGCQTVYQVLHQNNLKNYYHYNTHPGESQKNEKSNVNYLDEPNVVAKLVDFQDENITIVTFYVPAIHCSSCIWLLENLYRLLPDVKSSKVDFMKKQVTINFEHKKISLKCLVENLQNIGYDPKITLQDVVKNGNKENNNSLIAKLTIAGFCFGNSMMISFPDYFGMGSFEKEYAHFFGYMNLAFGIPVLFYSASDYFKSAWISIKNKQLSLDVPLALGIFVLFLRSAIEIVSQSGPGFMDTLCSLVFFILIGKWIQQRTYYHISFERDYRSYFPVAVTLIQDNKEIPKQISEIKIGDRILIRNNEIIPADAVVSKGKANIDFSFVTGESKPVEKNVGDIVYAGGRQIGSALELEVVKEISQSHLTRLWNNESFKSYDKKFETFVGYISKYFTIVLIIIAFAGLFFWLFNHNTDYAWGAFTAVLIIACPCALALSSPFTLSAAMSIFDKNKFYIKNTSAIEQMAAIDTIIFDKTGTITSPKVSSLNFEGELLDLEKDILFSICRNSHHPLSREIVKWLGDRQLLTITDYQEVIGKGQSATYLDYKIVIGSAKFVGAEKQEGTSIFIKINDNIKGTFQLEQSWRPSLSDVISVLENENYQLHLVSGDNERQSESLKMIFPTSSMLHFNQNPIDKLNRIEYWQKDNKKVCMLGDGLNDAGALRKANLGIAISDDINNFSPGCDAILDGASFAKIPAFFRFSKAAVRVIKMSFLISLMYNIIGISFALQGTMSPLFAAILMPISTISIISFTSLITRYFGKKCGLI